MFPSKRVWSNMQSVLAWLCLLIIPTLLSNAAFSQSTDPVSYAAILDQRLEDEQQSFQISKDLYTEVETKSNNILNETKKNNNKSINLEQFRLIAGRIGLHIKQLSVDKAGTEQEIISGENAIFQLELKLQSFLGLAVPNITNNQSLNNNIQNLQVAIKEHRAELEINKKRLAIIIKHIELLNKYKLAVDDVLEKFVTLSEDRNKQKNLVAATSQELKINQEIKNWLDVELQLKKDLKANDFLSIGSDDISSMPRYEKLQYKIVEAENQRGLLELQLGLLRLNSSLADISVNFDDKNKEKLKNKKNLVERVNRLITEAGSIQSLADSKFKLISDYTQFVTNQRKISNISTDTFKTELDLLNTFADNYKQKSKEISRINADLNGFYKQLTDIYLKDIRVRQNLPSDLLEWQSIVEDILAIPYLLSKQILSAWYQFTSFFEGDSEDYIYYLSFVKLIVMQSLMICSIILFYKLVDFLKDNYRGLQPNRFSKSAFYVLTRLLDNNKLFVCFLANVYSIFWLMSITGSFVKIFLWLASLYLLCRILLQLCYMFLIENIDEISGDDRRLYYGLKYSLVFGTILYTLMILGQELNLPLNTQTFIDRTLMLFLLAVSYPLIINWQVVPQLIIDNLNPKSYIRRAIWLIGLIIPITILSNAALGIIGYVNLAWKIALAVLQLSLVIALWLIIKGLFNELMEVIFRFFIRYVTNGWLWMESVLKPLQTVIHVLLFGSACIGLVFIYGWNSGNDLVTLIHAIVSFQLVNASGMNIFIKDFIIICSILALVIWATKWSREFSYRWLYAKTKDLGVRNSLAVFTQYTILVLGLIIVLKFIGFPTQTLTVAVGGLIFFLGFGLREILSNYVSGIILLIERPIRVGDFITVGEYEGKVTKIGMRSLTVQSFDNTEVIVPNTDTINKPLTNWTFRDTIIRCELEIRVSYEQNIDNLREIILNVLMASEEVLKEPKAKVHLKEFSESAVIAKMYFFIDLNKTPSRGAVRTSIMATIVKAFQEHKIKVAYPVQTINLFK